MIHSSTITARAQIECHIMSSWKSSGYYRLTMEILALKICKYLTWGSPRKSLTQQVKSADGRAEGKKYLGLWSFS